jgi:hypothetical protein
MSGACTTGLLNGFLLSKILLFLVLEILLVNDYVVVSDFQLEKH